MVCAGAVISRPGFAEDSITLDQLLSKDQQARLGVSTMRLDQREILRQALIGLFQRGYQVGRSDGLSVARQPPSALPPQTVVESQIDGDFNGWEGETIVKLMNGQIQISTTSVKPAWAGEIKAAVTPERRLLTRPTGALKTLLPVK